jgi:hypothetical protein
MYEIKYHMYVYSISDKISSGGHFKTDQSDWRIPKIDQSDEGILKLTNQVRETLKLTNQI